MRAFGLILLLVGLFFGMVLAGAGQRDRGVSFAFNGVKPMNDSHLSDEQRRILIHKGTERPFSGAYWNHKEAGVYACARCNAPLFASGSKFDSGCGWPSFDTALPGALRELPDADGQRTEIVCAACGGHMGHVFTGEGFTPKNTRHCVNSLSLTFTPADAPPQAPTDPDGPSQALKALEADSGTAYFAGGCFWGVEHWFEKAAGVRDAVSGYMGGSLEAPTYEQVCSGATGHAEVVRVRFDPARTTYEALATLFFEIHDPTHVNRQGPDIGEQYRSVVFVENTAQAAVIRGLIARLEARGLRVATTIEPVASFWPAEDYHQDYYAKTGKAPYCHSRVPRFD